MIARETVGQVLAEPRCDQQAPVAVAEARSMPVRGAMPGCVVPTGVRSKAKRLAARGWLAENRPGMFSVVAGRGGGS